MSKILKYIILPIVLLLFNSGQLFANIGFFNINQKVATQNQIAVSEIFQGHKYFFTVKSPTKEVHKKKAITVDNEEEEVDGMTSKKIVEKSKWIFSIFNQLSTNSFLNINKSLSLCNDVIPTPSYHSLYLLFEVFRI